MIFPYIEEKTEKLLSENGFFSAGFDVTALAKKLGVSVLDQEMEDDISGLFVVSEKTPIISYNKKEENRNMKRVRFTIAHELGHYILHSKEQPVFIDRSPKVMYRNSASTTGEIHREREANAFAASLLMPRKLIAQAVENTSANAEIITNLAKEFDVSEQAMSFRLANLGYDII